MYPYTNNLVTLKAKLASEDGHLLDYIDFLEECFQERESSVKAFLTEEGRFTRLRQDAQELIDQYPTADIRPPLFGVPVGVKDIFHVNGYETRAGSRLPAEEFVGHEAESVTWLKEAGALILGKTVSTEFAYFAPGSTCNPHNPEHTPGGSSSGSAAAVGAGICPLTLGTQTIGSINRPAAFCGVVGFKPSYERVSRSGVIPVSGSLDHVGFFARDTESAGLAASVLIPNWNKSDTDSRPVLGVPQGPYLENISFTGNKSFEETCSRLASNGFQIKRIDVMPDFDEVADRHRLIMAAEVAKVHSDWFGRYANLYHEKTSTLIRQGMAVSEQNLRDALPSREKLRHELMTSMAENNVDLWIAPAALGTAPKGLESTGDPIMNLPWTHSGLPTVSIPSDRNDVGLPFGLQAVGKWHADESVLAWAVEIEEVVDFYD
jgi:Asp-tRNA(Asn)/Glu-tRNA(Gln) amidotransferase A subunit family amidase